LFQYIGGVYGWIAGGINGMNAAYVSVGIDSFQKEFHQGRSPFLLTVSQIGLFGKQNVHFHVCIVWYDLKAHIYCRIKWKR
jgi:hypothetical protein